MTDVYVCRIARAPKGEKLKLEEMRKTMHPCPICGHEPFLWHSIVDGFDFGYAAGCPKFYLNDGIHGISDISDERRPKVNTYSAEEAVEAWNAYCERMEKEE